MAIKMAAHPPSDNINASVGTAPAPASIDLQDIACVRTGNMLFNHLSLSLSAGEALHLTGPNGSGKSSLIRLIAGLLPIFSGTMEIIGNIALSDENLPLPMQQPLAAALAHWRALDQLNPRQAVNIGAAMTQMGLAGLADVPLAYYSTGQRKRANLVMTMTSGADIWLLDEPGNGLDQPSLAALVDAAHAHLAAGGIIIFASHFPLAIANVQQLAVDRHVPILSNAMLADDGLGRWPEESATL